MSLRIRRGTEAQRLGFTPDMGEIIWTTNGEKLYVGDGVTPGGKDIAAQLAGTGLLYNAGTGKLDSVASFTTDQVTEGVNNKYFSQELAQDAIGAAILAGTQSGITVTYTDNGAGSGSINFSVTPDGVGITQVSDDDTPALGGDLDLNSHNISGTGNIDIIGSIDVVGAISGTTTISNGTLTFDQDAVTSSTNLLNLLSTVSVTPGKVICYNDQPANPFREVRVITVAGNSATESHINARGTFASPTTLLAGDQIYTKSWVGYTSSGYTTSAALVVVADTVGAGAIPSKIYLVTVPDGNTANGKGLSITTNGVGINKGVVDPEATLDINGFAKLAILTAEPATPANGMVAIADGTSWDPLLNGKQSMVVRLGGTWRELAAAA